MTDSVNITVEEAKNILSKNTCMVLFTKKDGTDRTMMCTRDFGKIPEDKQPKGTGKPEDPESTVIKVYDVEAQGWRSFDLNSVTTFAVAT